MRVESWCGRSPGPLRSPRGSRLLYAAHAHAEMLGVDHDHGAFGFRLLMIKSAELCRQPLLYLRPFGEDLERPGKCADADDLPAPGI